LPDPIVVDANVVTARLLASYSGHHRLGPPRADRFFADLIANSAVGIVTPMVFNEIIHVALKIRYQGELSAYRTNLVARYGTRGRYTWLDLYKLDPTIIQRYAVGLEQLRQLLVANNLLVIGHDDLGAIPSGFPYDQELVRLVGRYGLDSSDAAILLEAQRAGIPNLVTLDRDMQRASVDFDVYTWL
jgi:predicted nucleic acid-binding protein